jgi:hypothetical protein
MNTNKWCFRLGGLDIYLSTILCSVLLLGDAFTSADSHMTLISEDAKLQVVAPKITGFGQFFVGSSAMASTAKLLRANISNQGLDPDELFNAIYGSGRPGAEGDIVIEGVGLSGTTGIIFEGTGVSGVVETGPELNPMVFVHVRIEPWAELGRRQFTLLTPRGEVSSGDIAFTVREPSVLLIRDNEGAPGTSGYIKLFGVGLDQPQEIRFEGEGVRVRDFLLRGALNPSISLRLDIDSTAPLGPRRFSIVTGHGVIESQDVSFCVTNPRIDFIGEVEGAPGTSGFIQIQGVGLHDASAINFSETGVTGSVRDSTGELLNPHITVDVTIASDAPMGPRTFTLRIPRGSGTISSADTNVTLTVTLPRIDALSTSEAAPGASGSLCIDGVGIGSATEIQFEDGDGIVGVVRPRGEGVRNSLNPGVTVNLSISPTAPVGSRRFRLRLANGMVHSGDVSFTISLPRVTVIDTRGDLFSLGDPTSEVAQGTSGRIRIYGVGLFTVIGVRISGEGVIGRLEPTPRQGPDLNPYIVVTLTVSATAALGERTIELSLTGGVWHRILASSFWQADQIGEQSRNMSMNQWRRLGQATEPQ